MIIIVDSDGLIATSNKEDTHYSKSSILLKKLIREKIEFIYPVTVLAEATAILQIRLNKPNIANQILQLIKSGVLIIETVDQTILVMAAALLEEYRSKHITLFDAIVAIIALKYKADAIFSFDNFYKKKGFRLASELVR